MGTFFAVLTDNWHDFARGFGATIRLFLIAGVASLVGGTLLGAMRVSPIPALRAFGATYVNLIRNTPLTLVFAFMVFAVPKLGVNIDYLPSALVALSVYTAAFVCEVVRSGVNTVPNGQAEAARALGMGFGQVLGHVVLPQALRAMVAPMVSVFIAMLKNTTIAAGFSVFEAGAIPEYLSERGENRFAVLVWITIGFLVIIVPLALLQRSMENRLRVVR
ncbi:amino acid ABC transporter permease [Luedemannella flava]|uniref:Amino acid ABC transporter permease n=1 Tax=Luedemannella flava TaxID=349316 RepID=A0ABN2M642_9ACTN